MSSNVIRSLVPAVHSLFAYPTARGEILCHKFPIIDQGHDVKLMHQSKVLNKVVLAAENPGLFRISMAG
jgi:hypothetical protein